MCTLKKFSLFPRMYWMSQHTVLLFKPAASFHFGPSAKRQQQELEYWAVAVLVHGELYISHRESSPLHTSAVLFSSTAHLAGCWCCREHSIFVVPHFRKLWDTNRNILVSTIVVWEPTTWWLVPTQALIGYCLPNAWTGEVKIALFEGQNKLWCGSFSM